MVASGKFLEARKELAPPGAQQRVQIALVRGRNRDAVPFKLGQLASQPDGYERLTQPTANSILRVVGREIPFLELGIRPIRDSVATDKINQGERRDFGISKRLEALVERKLVHIDKVRQQMLLPPESGKKGRVRVKTDRGGEAFRKMA